MLYSIRTRVVIHHALAAADFNVIRYYSTYGHVARLAEEIKKGADSVDGVEATIWQVAETTLPEESSSLAKMRAPVKTKSDNKHPVISGKQLADADGVLFGFPSRLGMMAAQMKALFDSTTGGLWRTQALAGKPAGFFFSLRTQGGGQEEAALTAVSQLAHHAMVFVPVGSTFGDGMFDMDEVRCCSPYGAGTFAGADGRSRLPSDAELQMAVHQGTYFAAFAKKLKAGAAVVA
jgi:NAD(P)H dehydrogenase (quinone)